MDLFESASKASESNAPLAERSRPQSLADYLGLELLLKKYGFLRAFTEGKSLFSMVLWGPPGVGKTTLALLLAESHHAVFYKESALTLTSQRMREIGQQGHADRTMYSKRSICFIDEIHRLNRAQQDQLLPFMENGDLIIIGATTENPGYRLNRAILSRTRVVQLSKASKADLKELAKKSLASAEIQLDTDQVEVLIHFADGDFRRLLGGVEAIQDFLKSHDSLGEASLQDILGSFYLPYDQSGEEHYDTISAFIKSVRGSDANAALYYLARMIHGGEDPLFVARRLMILASEDIGNADPRALSVATDTYRAVEVLGMPEAGITLGQCVTYLASAPKSNRSYQAYNAAMGFVEKTGSPEIPLHLRSSSTAMSKSLGYGQGYKYPHSYPKHWVEQSYFPEELKSQAPEFYEPSQSGFEKQIAEYQRWLKRPHEST